MVANIIMSIMLSSIFYLGYDCSAADQAKLGQQLADCDGVDICEHVIKFINCKLVLIEEEE